MRLPLRDYIGHLMPPRQTAALVVLAFGMILRWRVGMYRDFKKLMQT